MSTTAELMDRIEVKKHAIQKAMAEMKADTSGVQRRRVETMQRELETLESQLTSSRSDLSAPVSAALNALNEDD